MALFQPSLYFIVWKLCLASLLSSSFLAPLQASFLKYKSQQQIQVKVSSVAIQSPTPDSRLLRALILVAEVGGCPSFQGRGPSVEILSLSS